MTSDTGPTSLARVLPLALAAVLSGCGEPASEPAVLERDSAGVAVVTITVDPAELPAWTLEDPHVVIHGGAPPYFGRVRDAMWLEDGGIAVADRLADQVHIFQPDGALVRTVGRSGDGPGEFSQIHGLATVGDSLLVHDGSHGRVSVFAANGSLVRTFQLPNVRSDNAYETFHRVVPIGGGRYAGYRQRGAIGQGRAFRGYAELWTNEAAFAVHSPEGSPIGEEVRYEGARSVHLSLEGRYMVMSVPFAGKPLFAADGTRIVYGHGDEFRLHIADSTLALGRTVRWPAVSEPLTDPEVEAFARVQDSIWNPHMSRETIRRIHDAILGSETRPALRPALGGVTLDPEGRIWAGRFEPADVPRSYYVLDRDGRPLARLRLPVGSRLTDVRGDRLLLVAKDSLDVESVTLHRIARPAT